jgi:hypothetical protein
VQTPTVTTKSISVMVADWSAYLKADLAKVILKKKIGRTGSLANSIKYHIVYDQEGPVKVVFEFKHYGQFVDMGVGKGQKLGDVKGNAQLLQAIGVKGRKAKKWYSKTIFPEANTLANLLKEQYGITAINMVNEVLPSQLNMNM